MLTQNYMFPFLSKYYVALKNYFFRKLTTGITRHFSLIFKMYVKKYLATICLSKV